MAKSRNPVIKFDRLQMYFGEPYVIDVPSADGILVVKQPTIGDMVRIGEDKFYASLFPFITNTTQYRLPLWQIKIDWNEFSDFNLFTMLYSGVDKDVCELFFGDLDITSFELCMKDDQIILYNEKFGIEINEEVYWHMSQYLRNVFNIFPEEKITKDPVMKEWFIQKDKRQKEIDKEKSDKGKDSRQSLVPIISACVNHPGFKYKLSELKDVGVCQFYDSVQRLQIYESTTALLKGMYSGFISSKGIKPDAYNFMKDISK